MSVSVCVCLCERDVYVHVCAHERVRERETWSVLTQWFLVSKICDEKFADNLFQNPFCVVSDFSLLLSKIWFSHS